MACDSSVLPSGPVAGEATAHDPEPAPLGSGSSRDLSCFLETAAAMGFINEVVSDADIDRYGLPFAKGSGRWWTRDRERDLYLWGGLSGNPAFDEPILGVFQLYIAGEVYEVVLRPGEGSISFSEKPYIVSWDKVISSKCRHDQNGQLDSNCCSLLKDALRAYGRNGRGNKYTEELKVVFNF